MSNHKPVLTIEETDALLLSAIVKDGCNEKDLQRLYDWAIETRTRNTMLDMVLSGKATVRIGRNRQPVFERKP